MPQTVPIKLVRAGAVRLLADAIANTVAGNHEGLVGNADLGLFKAWPGYSSTLTLASLTVADYTGYAIQPVVWGAPYIGGDGKPSVRSGLLNFDPSDAVTPNTILGVYLIDSAGALQAVGQLPAPVLLDSADASLGIFLELGFDPTWIIGDGIAES